MNGFYIQILKKWFNQHYVEGFEIDKDLLSNKNKKLYSPETCVFLPREINRFLCKTTNKKSQLPLGVYVSGGSIIAIHRKKYLGVFKSKKGICNRISKQVEI